MWHIRKGKAEWATLRSGICVVCRGLVSTSRVENRAEVMIFGGDIWYACAQCYVPRGWGGWSWRFSRIRRWQGGVSGSVVPSMNGRGDLAISRGLEDVNGEMTESRLNQRLDDVLSMESWGVRWIAHSIWEICIGMGVHKSCDSWVIVVPNFPFAADGRCWTLFVYDFHIHDSSLLMSLIFTQNNVLSDSCWRCENLLI